MNILKAILHAFVLKTHKLVFSLYRFLLALHIPISPIKSEVSNIYNGQRLPLSGIYFPYYYHYYYST